MVSRTADCSSWRTSCLFSTVGHSLRLSLVNRTIGVMRSIGCSMLRSMLQRVNTNTPKNAFMILLFILFFGNARCLKILRYCLQTTPIVIHEMRMRVLIRDSNVMKGSCDVHCHLMEGSPRNIPSFSFSLLSDCKLFNCYKYNTFIIIIHVIADSQWALVEYILV